MIGSAKINEKSEFEFEDENPIIDEDFDIENMKMRLRNRYSGFPYENQK